MATYQSGLGALNAERNVLGSCLLDESVVSRVVSSLSDKAFLANDVRNALVFKAIEALHKNGDSIDITTINNQLSIMQLEKECPPDFVFSLAEETINSNNADFYINIVRDNFVLREYFLKMDKAKNEFMGGKIEDIGEFLSALTNDLTDISNQRSVGGFSKSVDVMNELAENIEHLRKDSSRKLLGIDTGFPLLNDITHGWQPETLNIIAARPAVGKSAFAINLIYNAVTSSLSAGKAVAFFSCEMSSMQVMQRLLSSVSMVPLSRITTGSLNNSDMKKINNSISNIGSAQIYLDDKPNQLIGDILAKAEKLSNELKGKLGAIFIDYLNIISVPYSKGLESRTLQISYVTKALKELARKLHIPVICLTQVSREGDKGSEKGKSGVPETPSLSSLKESGAIEEDADIVLFLSRNDYYSDKNANEKTQNKDTLSYKLRESIDANKAAGKDEFETSVIDIIIRKNRQGKLGRFQLLFEKAIQRFSIPSAELISESSAIDND